MTALAEMVFKKARTLPDSDKLNLVDVLLMDLDKPDPAIEKLWIEEAHRRWKGYKAGKCKAIPFREIMRKLEKKIK
jgi:hypothetical protein